MKSVDSRYQQANKEALWAIGLTCAYFVWWYATGYGLAPTATDALPKLFYGLPLWFLLSCVIGPILFVVLCALMVKYCYQDIPLDAIEKEHHHE
ncbi:MAG: YhdT family protein [Enterovibrio sp.]